MKIVDHIYQYQIPGQAFGVWHHRQATDFQWTEIASKTEALINEDLLPV